MLLNRTCEGASLPDRHSSLDYQRINCARVTQGGRKGLSIVGEDEVAGDVYKLAANFAKECLRGNRRPTLPPGVAFVGGAQR